MNTFSWYDWNTFGWGDYNTFNYQGTPTPIGPGTVKTTLSLGLGI